MPPRKPAAKQSASASRSNKQPSVSPAKNQSLLAFTSSQQPAAGKLKSRKRPVETSSSLKSNSNRAFDENDSPNENTRPRANIQSFFNNAVQKQQTLSPSQTSHVSTTLDFEEIDSEDDKPGLVSLSKASSTALALRKRKPYQTNGVFGGNANDALPASQKFRRTDTGRVPVMKVIKDDKRSWVDQFAPKSVEDLAVHKRKIADVREWLSMAYNSRINRALILKGPAGSGKTATLRLLAKEMSIKVLEWSNPAGKDMADGADTDASQFEDFLARSGSSTGLTFVQEDDSTALDIDDPESKQAEPLSRQLILIEEFPNTYSKNSPALQSFRSAIAQHLASRGTIVPLILIVSETLLSTSTAAADSFTTHRLLGPELSTHPSITTIDFNAIAPTIMLKALENVVVQEARKSGRRTTPGLAVLKRLTEFGDIRSAISTLEFLCLQGDDDGSWSAKVIFNKPRKKAAEAPLTKTEVEALTWIASRESTLGIWHGVGKVLYNKRVQPEERIDKPEPWLAQYHRALKPENEVNDLVNDIGTDTSTFIAALHENYPLSCTTSSREQSMETIEHCIDNLSDSDLLCLDRFSFGNKAYSGSVTSTLRQDEMAFQLGVRGMLFHLPTNVKRVAPTTGPKIDAHRMYYPASLKLWRKIDETEAAIDALRVRLRSQLRMARRKNATAYSLANTNAAPWVGDDSDDTGVMLDTFSLAPMELFITSVPYLYSPLRRWVRDKVLNDLLKTVTEFRGRVVDADDNEPSDDADETTIEQWSTDRPDETKKQSRDRLSKKDGTAFDNGIMAPEQQIEALVLEDDDIED